MFLTRLFTIRNVGTFDRILRVLPTLGTVLAWWSGTLSSGWLLAAALISAMLLVTSLTGACSIYYLLGFSSCPLQSRQD